MRSSSPKCNSSTNELQFSELRGKDTKDKHSWGEEKGKQCPGSS